MRAREFEIEQRTFDKLKGNVPAFVRVYAAAAGQPQNDFFATADQALFAANGGLVNGWIAPASGNVSERMVQEKDPRKAAEDLYLTILSRTPTAEEVADVVRVLAEQRREQTRGRAGIGLGTPDLGRVPVQPLTPADDRLKGT